MELYEEIMIRYFAEHGLPEGTLDGVRVVQDICWRTILRIREILADESLDDPACFYKIEEIVCELEKIGLDAGGRHDFG